MKKDEFYNLLDKYIAGVATKDEEQRLLNFYGSFKPKNNNVEFPDMEKLKVKIFDKISAEIFVTEEVNVKTNNYFLKSFSIAAMITVALSIGLYFFSNRIVEHQEQFVEINVKNDIFPGKNKAILTLADGSIISLDDAAEGLLASQGDIAITKTDNGEIVYEKNKGSESNEVITQSVTNTIQTPKGGKFQIRLPDGSKVWLNSASKLSYPTVFKSNERKVLLNGEAYFEIASNKKVPFRVISNGQTVEVLGTHFNVNSYDNEDFTKTTLLEGSVRVILNSNNSGSTKMLRPGEQSLTNAKQSGIKVENADTEKAIAWKNGYFKFKNTPIQEIMREVERWYDVELVYEGEMTTDEFTGFISNDVNISAVLKILEQSGGVKFTVKGKKIKVKMLP